MVRHNLRFPASLVLFCIIDITFISSSISTGCNYCWCRHVDTVRSESDSGLFWCAMGFISSKFTERNVRHEMNEESNLRKFVRISRLLKDPLVTEQIHCSRLGQLQASTSAVFVLVLHCHRRSYLHLTLPLQSVIRFQAIIIVIYS